MNGRRSAALATASGSRLQWAAPMNSTTIAGASPGAADKAGRTRDLLAHHGIECPAVTGAGIGTFEFASASGVYTELQCGSYVFIDADYGRNFDRDGARPSRSSRAFRVSDGMSRPTGDGAIVDAGLKALAFDSGPPLVCATSPPPINRQLRARLRRARPPRHLGRHQSSADRRQDPPRPRPLRPDRQALRLVGRHPCGPCRATPADHHPRCGLLMLLRGDRSTVVRRLAVRANLG